MKKEKNVNEYANERTNDIKEGYIKEKENEILSNEGPVDSVKLREFLDAAGLNEIAKEYRKVLPVFLMKIENILDKNLMSVGTIDNIRKLIEEEKGIKLKELSNEDIIKYVKDNNSEGWVILQSKKDGTLDFYPPGKDILENSYEFVSDNKREKYMEKINSELKKYLKEKNIDVNKLPIVYKKNPVFMIKIEDIKSSFPKLAQKLLKDGVIVEHWGNFTQKIKDEGYLVFNEELVKVNDNGKAHETLVRNNYVVDADTNGYPIGYEPVDDSPNADGGYKPEI